MAHCFLAVKAKLECKLGYFDLIGCDFLIDENFKVLPRLSGRGRGGGCAGRQVQEAVRTAQQSSSMATTTTKGAGLVRSAWIQGIF